jgi:hypothetical protein
VEASRQTIFHVAMELCVLSSYRRSHASIFNLEKKLHTYNMNVLPVDAIDLDVYLHCRLPILHRLRGRPSERRVRKEEGQYTGHRNMRLGMWLTVFTGRQKSMDLIVPQHLFFAFWIEHAVSQPKRIQTLEARPDGITRYAESVPAPCFLTELLAGKIDAG